MSTTEEPVGCCNAYGCRCSEYRHLVTGHTYPLCVCTHTKGSHVVRES